MGSAAIECKNLTKYYGKSRGIDGLSLTVERGSTYGFLGPNGAGKTTTIRCLLGMLQATSGEAFVLGERVKLDGAGLRRRIGYVPGEVKLYEKETGRWHIDYISRFRGGPGSLTGELIERLAFDQGRRVRELSKGNRQKLALVLGLMHDPELLMLDEPTSGLDPLNQEVVFDIVSERVAAGATVFLSSHILSEVERACTTVGIIKEGRLVAEDQVESLLRKRLRKLEVAFCEPVGAEALSDVPGVKDITILSPRKVAAKVEGEGIDRLLKRLSAYEVDDLVIEHESLEEAFVGYYRKEAAVGESEADLPDRRKEVDRT